MLYIFDLDDTLYDTSKRLDDVTPNFCDMKLYGDAKNFLETSKDEKILVTYGKRDIQERKIDTLNIRGYFSEIIISETSEDKLNCFNNILKKRRTIGAKDIFVVGDRIDSEIKYGNMLGMTTIYLKRGKYMKLKPSDENEIPKYTIKSLEELSAL